ncbi:hypothetical protein Pelo_13951 [Pelomyxa schiedti]|nr:hypothetical protein Pelo_13951 [Pelomyxa schiedti]
MTQPVQLRHNVAPTINKGDAFWGRGSDEAADKRSHAKYVVQVSRVMWDHVFVPILEYNETHHHSVGRKTAAWMMTAAEAMFPLVPRICRAVAESRAAVMEKYYNYHWSFPLPRTSRYFPLLCAGQAGSSRCVDWMLSRMHTRNNRKECVTVLKGLCSGGHLGMAQKLIESDTAWRGGTLRWPVNEEWLVDDLREQTNCSGSLLFEACKGGHLDVVKWVMERLGVGRESWELVQPFIAAVRRGHAEVVKWMAASTAVVGTCKILSKNSEWTFDIFIKSQNLEVVKLCTEWFCGPTADIAKRGHAILGEFICRCPLSGGEFEEGCQWIKERYSVQNLKRVKNVKGFQWVFSNYTVNPTQSDVAKVCKHCADPEFVQHMLAKFTYLRPVTPDTFIKACGNKHGRLEVVQCLLPILPPLTVDHLQQSFELALTASNMAIAEWLDNTFHVMERFSAIPGKTESLLIGICTGHCLDSPSVIQWFLSRSSICNISEGAVIKAIGNSLDDTCLRVPLFLFDMFNITLDTSRLVEQVLAWGELEQCKHLVSRGGFSSSDFARAMSQSMLIQSGKVVKWLVKNFHFSEEQVKLNHNHLLLVMIGRKKKSCAEWLIRKFHVTLDELAAALDAEANCIGGGVYTPDVATFKMLLRVYPQITPEFVKAHFRVVMETAPIIAQVIMRLKGLKKDDIFNKHTVCWRTYSWEVCLWITQR